MTSNSVTTLYGYPGSGSAAVEAALLLAGEPHRLVQAASWDAESARDELHALNPLMQIPTLCWPEGTVMSESAAILIELGLRHPASGLLPAAPAARAQAIRGLVYIAANCYATIGVIDFPNRVIDEPSTEEADRIHARSRARLHQLWDDFARQFRPADDQPFLGGAQPGALDLLADVVSRWSGTRAHLARRQPALLALFTRLGQHPVVGPVLQRHWPPQA